MQLTNRRVRLMGTVIDVSIYHEEPEPLHAVLTSPLP